MHITLIGAGAWGTAMALAAARQTGGHAVTLHARDAAQADALRTDKQNARYLPGVDLPDSIEISSAPLASLLSTSPNCNLWVIATPMAGLRATLTAMANVIAPVVWLCKGLESGTGLMPHEVQAQVAPHLKAGALSGPSFALEVARQQPTALVAASAHAPVRDALVHAFHGPALRVYANSDIVGVEVGGAVKNVLAIATGLCDGLHLGLNARAALITRGLAEMTRLGLALGAHSDTFMGLSGLGDLVLTATGELSRNRKVGLLLAQGQTLDQAVASLGHVAEGVYSARTVMQRARALGVDMPITEAVVALLDARLSPREAVVALMGRDPKGEFA
ncbi:NAD(P)H-dependent glycerol-3-phosphate dehydrogenase [Limnohabitans sp. 63ED37-2]|uniref:NAD(P)H-dependent glycerol-3-phosphate dehydrogenase n=1 Tax=Limnohabitans sp. 63ED37-2 TaxID=1678128 RepID=UPI000706D04B|nr:NAD(P)H-dependent glycerol-3-phosphate dehydrogenase [Limnohabitans sp. 63ED37-2]ALK89693.1 Glycerol-3-phosphate dehydrogenase [NAD(P)+] [Limnohabitans sp. 63ED37-2]